MWPATRVGSQLGTRYSSRSFTKSSRSLEPQPSRNDLAGVRLFRFEGAIPSQPLPSARVEGIVAFSFLRIA